MGLGLALVAAAAIAVAPVVRGDGSSRDAQPAAAGSSLYVAATGSDSGRCTREQPCASFDRAYHLASPGQVVEVAGGTYPGQTLTADTSKTSTDDVVFRSAPGQLALIGGIVLKQAAHITFVGGSVATPPNLAGATTGLTLMQNPGQVNRGAAASVNQCSSDITFQGIDMELLTVNNSNDVSVVGGSIGGHNNTSSDTTVTPAFYTADQPNCRNANPRGILFSGVTFHDVGREQAPAAHPDCLQVSGTEGLTIERSAFLRCATSDILARPATNIWPGAVLTGIAIRNSFFGPILESAGSIIGLGAASDKCGDVVVEYNTVNADSMSAFSCGSFSSLKVVGNYERSVNQFTCNQLLPKTTVYDDNLIGFKARSSSASSCGTHSRLTGDPLFVDEANFNYRIRRGSPLIDAGTVTHPGADIDGKARPSELPADAGASQWDPARLDLGGSIGMAKLGMSEAELVDRYGQPKSVRSDKATRVATYRLHEGALIVTYAGSNVVGLGTTTPYYTSSTGLGVGSVLPGWATGHWLQCRHAFVRSSPSTTRVITSDGGSRGRKITAIALYRRSFQVCAR